MDARLKEAKDEGRTALVRFTNEGREPWSPWFVPNSSKLVNVPKEDKLRFELYMATRRTRFNPHEVFTVRVLLPKPLSEYPDDVALHVLLSNSAGPLTYTPSPLLPDE
jgi:hypothetical protein